MKPIAFTEVPSGDAQALLAAALTLMTAYAHGEEAARAETAAEIAQGLGALAARPELDASFRRLCARLRDVWAAAA